MKVRSGKLTIDLSWSDTKYRKYIGNNIMKNEVPMELYILYTDEDKGWFVSHEFGYLFEMNLRTGECNVLAKILQCYEEKKIYDVRYKKGEYLYLFPDEKGPVLIYDLAYKRFREVQITDGEYCDISVKEVHIINDNLYIVCAGLKKIVRLDKDKILNMYDLKEDITGYSVSIEDKIFCVSKECSVITELNAQNGEVKYFYFNGTDRLGNIIYDGTKIWISGYDSYIYIWDYLYHDILDKIEIPQNLYLNMRRGEGEKQLLFQRIICSENYIWLIPFCTNYFLYIHKEDKKIHVLKIGQEDELNLPGAWFRFISILENRYFWVSSIRQAKLFQVDMEQAVVYEKKVVMEDNVWEALLDEHFRKEIVYENCGASSLRNYISCINKISDNIEEGQNKKNGKEIYRILSHKEYD